MSGRKKRRGRWTSRRRRRGTGLGRRSRGNGEEGNVFLERCVAVHLCEYVSAIGCSDSSLVVAYLLGEQGEVPKYPIR